VLAHPAVASAIPGAQTVAEVRDNVAMASAKIPVAVWDEMRAEKLIPDEAPTPRS
jgi:D-threo-aldose 1-dehydrogenase